MSLEKQFDKEMLGIYHRAKDEAGYKATVFFRMLTEKGGLETARYLIATSKPSDGYTALHMKGRLDLTVEAMIWDHPEYQELFSDAEMRIVKKRLVAYEYGPAMQA